MGGAQQTDKQSADESILITLCLHHLNHSVCGYCTATSVMASLPLISKHASANQVRRLAVITVTPSSKSLTLSSAQGTQAGCLLLLKSCKYF